MIHSQQVRRANSDVNVHASLIAAQKVSNPAYDGNNSRWNTKTESVASTYIKKIMAKINHP